MPRAIAINKLVSTYWTVPPFQCWSPTEYSLVREMIHNNNTHLPGFKSPFILHVGGGLECGWIGPTSPSPPLPSSLSPPKRKEREKKKDRRRGSSHRHVDWCCCGGIEWWMGFPGCSQEAVSHSKKLSGSKGGRKGFTVLRMLRTFLWMHLMRSARKGDLWWIIVYFPSPTFLFFFFFLDCQ